MDQTPLVPSRSGTSDRFLEPERIVRYFQLSKGDYVADFGVGHGYFAIPMARAVGNDGKVYAIDIQKEVLDVVRTKARLEHMLNIEFIRNDIESPQGSSLKDKFIDFVLIANILFQAERRGGILHEAKRVLREGGKLAIIEWDQNAAPLGPPAELRLKKESVKNLALDAGFTLDREFEAGNHQYGFLFIKK